MGAATNFGRDKLGINSPTHRSTHAEDDLFATNDDLSAAASKNNNLLDDIFKTCATVSPTTSPTTVLDTNGAKLSNNSNDDFFNPRGDEPQEFGDFACAFGNTSDPIASVPTTHISDTKKDGFADFSSAFETKSTTCNVESSADLLFATNLSPAVFDQASSKSSQKIEDLLSDLDGLSLDSPVPSGKF